MALLTPTRLSPVTKEFTVRRAANLYANTKSAKQGGQDFSEQMRCVTTIGSAEVQ